jgi:hypothetical protein
MSTVQRLALLALVIAFTAFAPGTALAQVTRGGVEVARVVPTGMEIVDVVVPARAEIPVRLALAPRDAQTAALLVDVLVAPDAARAREALAWQLRTMQGEVAPAPGLGDEGYADDGYAAFARDNVMIAVRRVDGATRLDVRAIAARMDAAVLASPAGPTRASARLQLPALSAMSPGDTARIALPEDALEATIEAAGDAAARRTRTGFLVEKTGAGAAHLAPILVDRHLRTSH